MSFYIEFLNNRYFRTIMVWVLFLFPITNLYAFLNNDTTIIDFDKRVEIGVNALNKKIQENDFFYKSGQLDKIDFIVDVRSTELKEVYTLPQPKVDLINAKLTEFNLNYLYPGSNAHVSYYLLLSDLFLPSIAYNTDYQEYFDKEFSSSEVTNNEVDEFSKRRNIEIDEYTRAVSERSRLGNETNYGLLQNITFYIDNTDSDPPEHFLRYRNSFVLGNRLSVSSVKNFLFDIKEGTNPYSGQSNRFYEYLDFYSGYVIDHFNKLLSEQTDFTAKETGNTIDAKLFPFPYSVNNDFKTAIAYTQSPNLDDVTNGKTLETASLKVYNSQLKYKDYANIEKIDPNFIPWFWNNFGESSVENIFPYISSEITNLNIVLYITSDYSTTFGKSAIQLAQDYPIGENELKTMVVGLHLRADGSDVNIQVTSKYSYDIKRALIDDRNDAGYWWYLDETTGKGIQLPAIIPTVYKYDFNENKYKTLFLGKYRAIDDDGKPYYNDYSNNYLWAKFYAFDKGLEANEEAAMVTLNVLITIGSMGSGSVAIALTNVSRKVLIETGEEFLKGVVIDWTIQSALNYYLSDLKIPDCYYENIDLLSLGASGLGEIVQDKSFDAISGCMVNANQEFLKSGRLDYTTLENGGIGCLEGAIISVFLGKALDGGGRYASMIINHININPAKFVSFCRNVLRWSDEEIITFSEKFNINKDKLGLENLNITNDANLLKADGEFIDGLLETDYSKYVARKTAQGKAPRERLDWKDARDYWLNNSPMARGNAFNKTAVENDWYLYNEVNLENGKRLDSYDPVKGEIVSRKATNLEEIELSTFEIYLKELSSKYSAGNKIRSNKYPDIDGQVLQGKQILEIPSNNQNFSQIQDYIDLARSKYNIEIRFRPE